MRKILFVTGTRADYGKIKSLIKAVEKMTNIESHIFVSGMHLLKYFGSTYQEIQKDGLKNVYIAFGIPQSENMSVNLGNTVIQLTGYVQNLKPDMIVVHGDRIDALAGAMVGAFNNILVAHIEGGEVSGTIDESTRHAVSKFAHVHFVSNDDARKRLIQLGENDNNIHVIGSPDIDIMKSNSLPNIDAAKKRYGIDFNQYGIFMYHPVTTEIAFISKHILQITSALIESNENYIVVFPNNDLGSEIILNELTKLKSNKKFKIFPSLRFEYFLTFLKNAQFMIGNSSAGVRETSIYGIPSIDIGTRQKNRYDLKVIKNIQHTDENKKQILSAIKNISKFKTQSMAFGNGNSTELFVEIISQDKFWQRELQKVFIDLQNEI